MDFDDVVNEIESDFFIGNGFDDFSDELYVIPAPEVDFRFHRPYSCWTKRDILERVDFSASDPVEKLFCELLPESDLRENFLIPLGCTVDEYGHPGPLLYFVDTHRLVDFEYDFEEDEEDGDFS